jgi:hypothetical protein
MRKNSFRWAVGLLSISAVWVMFAGGCATGDEESFNENFNQDLPTAPKYTIKDVDPGHFKIEVHQGSPLPGPERVTYMKQAATIVARDEAHRRGWGDWQLDYIDERDQGWMHILVADVKDKPAAERTVVVPAKPVTAIPPPPSEPPPPPPGP